MRRRSRRSGTLYWSIYAEETPVGFVMIADEVGSPDCIAHYLWKAAHRRALPATRLQVQQRST
jgi:hypothetical protein